MLTNEKILITGPTSQVGLPVIRELVTQNEVYGLARFSREEDRGKLEEMGARCITADLATDTLDEVPDDVTYVLNFAVVRTGNFDYDLAANAEGAGRLMYRCRQAKAFLHCSSGAVYEYAGHKPLRETDALGNNHRVMMPTYSISKIAAEAVVRFVARQFNLRTTIARFSVPYGNNGGWPWFHLMMMKAGHAIPVHTERPSIYNPIHEDDYISQIPRLLEIASVPATIVNWAGSEQVSIEEWCEYLGQITGLEVQFEYTDKTLASLPMDLSRMHHYLGETKVPWRDGLRRMVEARNPELLPKDS